MIDTNLQFYGNWSDLSMRFEQLKLYYFEMHEIIHFKKALYKDVDVSYEENEMLFNRKEVYDCVAEHKVRESVLISAVTMLEVELRTICHAFSRTQGLSDNLEQFGKNKSVMDLFKEYCKTVKMVDFDFGGGDFATIRNIIVLRNCIVHNDGTLYNYFTGVRFDRAHILVDLNKKFPSIRVEDDYVWLDNGACIGCIEQIENFLNKIYRMVLEKYQSNT